QSGGSHNLVRLLCAFRESPLRCRPHGRERRLWKHHLRPGRRQNLQGHPAARTEIPPQRGAPAMKSFSPYPIGANERQSRIDWLLFAALGCLMVVGALFVFSATMANESTTQIPWYNQPWFRQVLWYGLDIVAMFG